MTVTTPPRPSAPDVIHDSGGPDPLEPLIEEADPEALIEEARRRTRRRRLGYSACALLAAVGALAYLGFANGGGGVPAPVADAKASFPAFPAVPADPNAAYFELWFVRAHGPRFDAGAITWPTWRSAAQLGISPDEDIHTRRQINGPDENRRATDLLEGALTSWMAGPTPADQERLAQAAREVGYSDPASNGGGWITSPEPMAQLLGVTLSNGIATIDIAPTGDSDPLYGTIDIASTGEFSYLDGHPYPIDLLFAQLVLTATQFPFVDGVLFKLDGQPLKAQIIKAQILKDPLDHELVERPVTRADYELLRGEDVISRQGPAT